MSTKDNGTNNKNPNQEVVLRDLQSLLRKSIGEQVEVVSFTAAPLLPIGENYGSLVLKVDAVIRRANNAPEEELPLVAKMMPNTDIQQSVLDLTTAFAKEIFVFEKLLDVYKQIEEEANVKPENIIDILPKFYGGRLSIKNPDAGKADEDVVLLMENLKTKDYYTMDRMEGLDLEHAKLAITELARFHALGIAVKRKRPDFFEEVKKQMDKFPFRTESNEEYDQMVKLTVEAICADERIVAYADRVRASALNQGWEAMLKVDVAEPWVTITHGDFWLNNIMFRRENGKVKDVKFIDFQICRVCSPLKDLPYFLCSISLEGSDNHFNELLDIYYKKFIEVLKEIGCDDSPFSRSSFEEQLKKDGRDSLFRCLMAMKVFMLEISDGMNMEDVMSSIMTYNPNSRYMERARKIVLKFVEKEWI